MIGELLAAAAAGPLVVTVLNGLTWRRPAPAAGAGPVSVLIPARNEAANIDRCVRAALAQPEVVEVVVVDDGSTDGTAERVSAIDDPRVVLIQGEGLPPGWVGKPHACHQLARRARSPRLLFVDADTTLSPGAVARLASVDADVVSALPRQQLGTTGEAAIVALLHLTYASWLPLALVRWVSDPRVLAANGQVLSISRAAYDAIGGFEAVRAEVVDDMALCRAAKVAGHTVAFVDGFEVATCRMYGSGREAVDGFSKNLYEGLGHPLVLAAVLTLYFGCFVAPWLAAPFAPWAWLGVAANLTQRALLAWRFRLPASTVALHLPSALAFGWIAVRSLRWSRGNAIAWRGRVYAARAERA
ncbi:MAG: glycosyltransferase [Myxococcota bacterium]